MEINMREEKILSNIGLIHKVMKDLNYQYRSNDDFDEVFFYGLVGLIKGIDTYDATKSRNKYLYVCIANMIKRLFQKRTSQMRTGETISLELGLGNSELALEQMLADPVNIEREYIQKERIDIMLTTLERYKNKKHRDIVKENFGIGCNRKSIRAIAKERGMSSQAVFEARKKVLTWLKNELGDII